MKFTFATVVAFAVTALARPYLTNSEYPDLEAGDSITLKWANATGPVTITLMDGPKGNLKPVKDLVVDSEDDEFTYTAEDVVSGTYAFRIYDTVSKDDPNYSPQFQIEGDVTTTTTSSSSSSSSSTTTTRSSTSSTTTTTPTPSANTTSTTTSRTTTSPTSSPTNTPANNLNGAERYSSSLALVLITFAAILFLN